MSRTNDLNLSWRHGDSYDYQYTLFDPQGSPLSLASGSVIFQIKTEDSPTAPVTLEKYYNRTPDGTSGVTLQDYNHQGTTYPDSALIFEFTHTETNTTLNADKYFLEITYNTATGKRYTTDRGTLSLNGQLNPDN